MKLTSGTFVWIPCEVKPGAFSNERSVLIRKSEKPWIGFVEVQFLKEPITSGSTSVKAKVLAVQKDRILLALPGHPLDSSRVRSIPKEDITKVPLVPVPA